MVTHHIKKSKDNITDNLKKILATYITDEGLMSPTFKELLSFLGKKPTTP